MGERGASPALYGYTMMFRMTGDEKYLEHAENIADMLLSRLPVDGIPYWDFDALTVMNIAMLQPVQ